jgi:hypothetical protein
MNNDLLGDLGAGYDPSVPSGVRTQNNNSLLIQIVIYITEKIVVNGDIINLYLIKKNINDSTVEQVSITESYIKDLHNKMTIKNLSMSFKSICGQTFLKELIKTTKQIPLFKENGIDENGKMQYIHSRTLSPRKIKNPHELTSTFRPKTLKRLSSPSPIMSKMTRKRINALTSQERKKFMNLSQSEIYKLRYGTRLHKNRFKKKTIKKSLISEPFMEDNANIGLLIITTHGDIMYDSTRLGNLKIIPIPIEIKNTYYRSYAKPGLYAEVDNQGRFSPNVSPTNDSDDIYKYEGSTTLKRLASMRTTALNQFRLSDKRKRSIYEQCFKDTNDKLKFYKYFFNCGLDYIIKYKKQQIKRRNPYDADDTSRAMGDIVDNGKVNYLLNKIYTTDGSSQKITFIFYNTEEKQYRKYDLFRFDDFKRFCSDFSIDEDLEVIKNYSQILNPINALLGTKRATTLELLEILKYLNLDFLYIYDETCSTYRINEELIEFYRKRNPTISQLEINKEITKEIYDEVNKRLVEENKKVGI